MTSEGRVRVALGILCFAAALVLSVVSTRFQRSHVAPVPGSDGANTSDPAFLRRQMVLTALVSRGYTDRAMLRAFVGVPRHEFVTREERPQAYQDVALPLPGADMVLAPSTLALVMQFARVRSGQRILLVGTGSGYEAAVLAKVGAKVWTTEASESRARQAAERLGALGFEDIRTRSMRRWRGWSDEAPYDRILVRLPMRFVPDELRMQVAAGGCLTAIVGEPREAQRLVRFERTGQGFEEIRGDLVALSPPTDGRIIPALDPMPLPTPAPSGLVPLATFQDD